MVPSPWMRSGTAVNRAPTGGSCSSPVRCSMTGMPAASSGQHPPGVHGCAGHGCGLSWWLLLCGLQAIQSVKPSGMPDSGDLPSDCLSWP
jgi:hypothetical protein